MTDIGLLNQILGGYHLSKRELAKAKELTRRIILEIEKRENKIP